MNSWILRFIGKVRINKKVEPYPSETIHQILAGMHHRILDSNPSALKFLDKSETSFKPIHGTCDAVYRDLHFKGIGTEASIITPDEEDILWQSEVMSVNNQKGLQRA